MQYLFYGLAVIAGFIVGYAFMWIRSRRKLSTAAGNTDLARTQNARASEEAAHQLSLAHTQNDLAQQEAATRRDMAQSKNAIAIGVAAHQLDMARMQNSLASAAIDSRRGEYESARQAASIFFTTLRDEANKGDSSSLSRAQRDGIEPVFTRRDEIISLLARNDPAATDRLSDLYVLFREFLGK